MLEAARARQAQPAQSRRAVGQLDAEMRRPSAVGKRQRAAVRLDEFGGDDEAKPRAALFVEP